MFDVAATVSEYPDFVPWCRSVDVKVSYLCLPFSNYIHFLITDKVFKKVLIMESY